ncbi:hypothetical protein MVES1_000302 [Malassezia vespertilionis]|uniref:VASt domain-containing protein n=1 Tax=Malassezia vespertilionis TaxID=2020962 RepID=A0A2N1JGY4_9BASI|nr:uncharacterized protein MVES1_000302 [Malassezia vespertilionis]PKI85798.1 hypothetical protein MVES_000283 [Malassezia vespertilionis]WFD04977.1 hypothetical protein MVES1_000302 [Malassezia vespertilionis]
MKRSDSIKTTDETARLPSRGRLNRHEIARLSSLGPGEGAVDPVTSLPVNPSPVPLGEALKRYGRTSLDTNSSSQRVNNSSAVHTNVPIVVATDAVDESNTAGRVRSSSTYGAHGVPAKPLPVIVTADTAIPGQMVSVDPTKPQPYARMELPNGEPRLPIRFPIENVAGMDMQEHMQLHEPHGSDACKPAFMPPADDEIFSNKSATGAYRDLSTGAVVETDDDGNTAEPTQRPSMHMVEAARVRDAPSSPILEGKGPTSAPPMAMPGLLAAADFLDADAREHGMADIGAHVSPNTGKDATWQDMQNQVTGFAVASSKRNADFHHIFPSVPEDDFLIESHGCAMSKDLLIQGRLYVSEGHVCFHSNIFGWVTSIVVPFSDIISIVKRNTAYLIPNAVQIRTLHNKYLFSSLVSRDLVYSMLVNIWRLSHPSDAAREASKNATDEKIAEKDGVSDPSDKTELTHNNQDGSMSKRERLRKRLAHMRHHAKQLDDDGSKGVVDGVVEEDDSSGSESEQENDSDSPHPVTHCNCGKQHLANVVFDAEINATPRQVFDLLFASDFMQGFLTDNQHLIDVNISNWKDEHHEEEGITAARDMSYIKPLSGPVGPKQTKCSIAEQQLHIDFDDYCTTMTITRTPDVPNGSIFCVKTRTCFTWAEHNSTRMFVSCGVEWTGRSLLKGIIERASIDGQTQYYKDMNEEINKYLQGHRDEHSEHAVLAGHKHYAKSEGKKDTTPLREAPSQASEPPKQAPKEAPSTAQGPMSRASGAVQDTLARGADMLGMRPSVFVLSALIVLLVISNAWMHMRTSHHISMHAPHGIASRLGQQDRHITLQRAALLMEEEVHHVLASLAYTRRLSEEYEKEIRDLLATIQTQTKQRRDKLERKEEA